MDRIEEGLRKLVLERRDHEAELKEEMARSQPDELRVQRIKRKKLEIEGRIEQLRRKLQQPDAT